MTREDSEVREHILSAVEKRRGKITPLELEKEVLSLFDLTRREAKRAIKREVQANRIAYVYHYGRTFLEVSLNRPYEISENVILKPPAVTFTHKNKRVVTLLPGISFGCGTHDTTRLCVRAIDRVLSQEPPEHLKGRRALDIGTGSGILALTAAHFGVGRVHANDLDPMAVHEARENVALNQMESRILVSSTPCQPSEDPFDYLFANLRYPTLMNLYETFSAMLKPKGILILSGIKSGEEEIVQARYGETFRVIDSQRSGEWVGMILEKSSGSCHLGVQGGSGPSTA